MELCKSIDRRVRPDQTPFRQFYFDELPKEIYLRLEEVAADAYILRDMTIREIGELCRNQKAAPKVLSLAEIFPLLKIDVVVQPITRGVLKITVDIQRDFKWIDRYHGIAEPYYLWVEDGENEYIYHSEQVMMNKNEAVMSPIIFNIPVREPLPPQYYIRVISDR